MQSMAAGAAKLLGSDCAVSISGIAGPGGGTEVKPVGLVYIGTYFNGHVNSRSLVFSGNRDDVRERSVMVAINILIETVCTANKAV